MISLKETVQMDHSADYRPHQRPPKDAGHSVRNTPLSRRLVTGSPNKVSPRRTDNSKNVDARFSESDRSEKPNAANSAYLGLSETIGGHISLAIILLPSLAAVFSPYLLPGSTSTAELVNLITDSLMIFVVSWFIKFAIEWPWAWLKQIEDTKLSLIRDINNKMSNSFGPPFPEDFIVKSLVSVKRLQNYESLAYFSCFCGMLLGAVIMSISRNYIIIDESRKLVFSNFNVALVFFWGSLKLVLSLTARLQKHSILLTKNETLEEMNFVTESNLDSLLPEELLVSQAWWTPFVGTFAAVPLVFGVVLSSVGASKERKTQSQKIDDIQSMIQTFHQDVQTYSLLQSQDFSNIKGALEAITLVLEKFGDRRFAMSSISNPEGTNTDNGIFLKPFPLNLSNSSREPLVLSGNFAPALPEVNSRSIESAALKALKTIYEDPEDNQDEHRPILLPRNSAPQPEHHDTMSLTDVLFSKHSNIVQPKPLKGSSRTSFPVNVQRERQYGQFSLHGIPYSTTVKESLKRHVYHTSPHVNGRLGNHLEDLMGYDGNSTATYELLPIREDFGTAKTTLVGTFRKVGKILRAHFQNISMRSIVKDPIAMSQILYGEAMPEIYDAFQPYYRKLQERVQSNKTVLWEVSNKYVLRNYHQVAILAIYYLQPLQRAQQFWVLFFVRLPLNTVRLGFTVTLFVPKVLIRAFLLQPLILLNELISDNVRGSSNSARSTKMRDFNLENARSPRYVPLFDDLDFLLSKKLLSRLLRVSGQEQEVKPRPRKPVYMLGL